MAASLVREARRRAGISQRELARRAGTSQPAVARIEAGRQSPGHATLARLVAACGLELRYELDGGEPATPEPPQAPEVPEPAASDGQLLVVEAGGQLGLAVADVRSVEPWAPPRRLPYAAEGVLGVVRTGRRLVTVLDPLVRMGAGRTVESPRALVVLTVHEGAYAIAVEAVVGLEEPPSGAVQPPPAALASPPAVRGVALLGDHVVTVVDPTRLIPV